VSRNAESRFRGNARAAHRAGVVQNHGAILIHDMDGEWTAPGICLGIVVHLTTHRVLEPLAGVSISNQNDKGVRPAVLGCADPAPVPTLI